MPGPLAAHKCLRHACLIAMAALGFAVLLFEILGLRINLSPSLPIGIYMTTSDSEASLVEFCPPEPYASFALHRGYRGGGTCPDGGSPLLKPVVSVPGDLVEISQAGIAVQGKLVPNTAPRSVDTQGRPIKHFPFGVYSTVTDTVWVASCYNSRSFDSRYFGPIAISSIRDRLRPLLTK